jgi:putative ABC transport system permease protein
VTLHIFRIFWWQIARDVRRHRLLALCNVLSIALGIAVYLAIRIANASSTQSFQASVDLVAGKAHLEIRGDVDERLWPEIARQPGIEAVTGVVEALATVRDRPGEYLRLTGIDVISGEAFSTFAFRADAGDYDAARWFSTPGGVAVTADFAQRCQLQVDSRLPILINGQPAELTVLAILGERGAPVESRFAVMDLGWLQELLHRPGRLGGLQLRLREPLQAERIAAQLAPLTSGLTVAPPRQRSTQVGKMLAAFQLNLSALSMVSLLVGVFLVYNTVSTSVARRRVQVGVIRALGVTRFRVRALFLGEALLYAVPGILLGLVGGVLLAQKLAPAVGQTVTSLYTLVNVEKLWLEPSQFIVAGLYGMLSALVGAWGPAAEASRVEPAEALRRGVEKPAQAAQAARFWLGGLAMLCGAALCGWAAVTSGPAWLAFAAAFLVLAAGAAFAPLTLQALGALTRRLLVGSEARGTPLRLAAQRLSRSLRRNAVTTAALAAAVAMFIALLVMVHSFRVSLESWIGRGVVADLFVAPAANEVFGLNSFLPPEAVAWLRARPDVAGADTFREVPVTVFTPKGPEPALLASVGGIYRENFTFLQGDEHAAMRRVFAGEAVVVSEPFARRFRLGAGDSVTLEGSHGPQDFAIAGVYADYTRDQGYLLMAAPLFAKLRQDPRVMSAAVYLRPGADAVALEAAFRAQFAGEWSIHSSRALRERVVKIFDQTFAVTNVLRTVAILVAIAGVLLTTLTSVLERRRELALLAALGGTKGFVGAVVFSEAGLLGLAAALLGVLAGLPLAMVMTWVVNPAFFGWTIQFHLPWAAVLGTPVWVVATAVIAAWWPSRVAREVNVAEALHEE